MRTLRILIFALAAFLAFYLYTTHNRRAPWIGNNGRLQLTEAAGPQKLDSEEQTNVDVYKKALASVVNIKSRAVAYNFFYGLMPEEGQGTGFVLDKEGHILTNYHVIANAQKIEVTLYNRKTVPADLVGEDRQYDLAVLKINVPNLTPVTLGDSQNLQVGMKVLGEIGRAHV